MAPARDVLMLQSQSPHACPEPAVAEDNSSLLTELARSERAWKTPILTSTYARFFGGTSGGGGASSSTSSSPRPRTSIRRVMEIGVFRGCSLAMWARYFPTARIVGVDHFTGQQGTGRFSHLRGPKLRKSAEHIASQFVSADGDRRIQLRSADQSSAADLDRLVRNLSETPFDLIIDDGSHRPADQLRTFEALLPLVRPGGWYVIEDIGSSWNRAYGHLRGGLSAAELRASLEATALGLVTAWLRHGRFSAAHRADLPQLEKIQSSIRCAFFAASHDGATALFRRGGRVP